MQYLQVSCKQLGPENEECKTRTIKIWNYFKEYASKLEGFLP